MPCWVDFGSLFVVLPYLRMPASIDNGTVACTVVLGHRQYMGVPCCMVHIWGLGAACDAVAVAWIILGTAGVGRIVTVIVVAAAAVVAAVVTTIVLLLLLLLLVLLLK